MIEPRPFAATRPRRARVRPYIQVHAMPRHVVVVVMCIAMRLASLEVAVLHVVARVNWVVVELCEFAGRLVRLARR
eukprot:7833054-Lingulodinium_polyedra.AAC.1